MGKMKNSIIISAICLTAIIGCTSKELLTEEFSGQVQGNAKIHAIYENGALTKTSLSEKNDDGVYPVVWSSGDKLTVFCDADKAGSVFTLTSGAGTNNAIFTGNTPEAGEQTYYAIYPSHFNAAYNANSIQIPMPQTQEYVEGSFGINNNPALAITTVLSTDTSQSPFNFKNLCGVLQLNLKGDVRVGRISVKDGCIKKDDLRPYIPLWGEGVVELDNPSVLKMANQSDFTSTSTIPGVNRFEVLLSCNEPVELNTEEITSFHVVLPVGSLAEGLIVTVYDNFDKAVCYFETSKDNSIERAKITEMPETLVAVASHSMNNLSANGTANCYMVKPDGNSYSFDAVYRGNSVKPIGAIAKAGVLWSTDNSKRLYDGDGEPIGLDKDIIKNVLYSDGKISFTTTANAGNAVIAAYDSKDEVIWSWHIWSSDYTASSAYTFANGAEIMDRNLGSLAPLGIGLFYEWGRKDPLILFENNDEKNPKKVIWATSDSCPFSIAEQNGVSHSISHPTEYIPGVPNWFKESDVSGYQELWNPTKTEYDPCPAGWKVVDDEAFLTAPSYNFSTGWSTVTYEDADGNLIDHDGNPYEYWTLPESGVSRTIVKISETQSIKFPGIWSEGAYRGDVYSNGHAKDFYSTHSLYRPGVGGYTSDLKQVRCQREGTGTSSSVIDLSEDGTANCYVVSPGKKYKFKATVKGNSNESVGAAFEAKVLMATINDSVEGSPLEASSVGYKDGYVYFETALKTTYGNAVIGIFDVNENVLWSWHIWCTDNIGEYTASTGKVFMGRNLGALSSGKKNFLTNGFLYQWGRKDPFLPALANDSNSNATCTSYQAYDYEQDDNNHTVEYAVSHPWLFFPQYGETNDWLKVPDNTLWAETKTKYDPCPKGWRVPSKDEWDTYFNLSFDKGIADQNDHWYPAAGYRKITTGELFEVGKSVNYWMCEYYADGAGESFFCSETSSPVFRKGNKAAAYSIRCVKE